MYSSTTAHSASALLLQLAPDFILPTVSVHFSPAVALQDGVFPVRDVTFLLPCKTSIELINSPLFFFLCIQVLCTKYIGEDQIAKLANTKVTLTYYKLRSLLSLKGLNINMAG